MSFDIQAARFSTNFLEDPPPLSPVAGEDTHPTTTTNPFRSESPSNSPELDHTFDFASNLETHDSVSSLDQIASPVESPGGEGENGSLSPSQLVGNSDSTEVSVVAEVEGETRGEEHPPPAATLVARTSDHWETFGGNGEVIEKEREVVEAGEKEIEVVEKEIEVVGTANGGPKTGEQEQQGNWEKFEEARPKAKKLLSAAAAGEEPSSRGGAVCAADAMVSSDAQWTALEDSSNQFGEYDDSQDDGNLPFRSVKSMRVASNRKVQIVDALRQRRLSNSSLDREPRGNTATAQFKNEDELTRTFKVEREWQVFVKMDKRVPGTKTYWLPVNISVKDGVLVIKRSAPPSMPISSSSVVPLDAPPLHEIRLYHNHTLTKPVLRVYSRKKKSKVHQIKLQQTQVHERRTLRRWLFVEHVSTARTIVKLGCPDLILVQSLSDQINEAIRQLPVTRQQGVAYRMNEVFVDVKDNSTILMNCDGAVLERRSLNRIYVQAFLSGSGECRVILNDIEGLLLQGKGQMTTSMSRQVRLNDVVLHPCVDKATYKSSRELKFRPVDGYPFELLRCSVDPYVSPPVNVNALMEYNEQRNTVKITASFSIRKKHNLRLRPIKDLVIKFPIPSSWSSLFLADSRFGGKKSVRSTAALRGSFRRKVRSSACQIETPLGSAKYEPEHGAILWRVGHYVGSSQPHTFSCDVQLKAGMHKPDISKEHCEVTYTLPGNSTGLQIRAFKVDNSSPERWVKYEIIYHYSVQMFPDLSID